MILINFVELQICSFIKIGNEILVNKKYIELF